MSKSDLAPRRYILGPKSQLIIEAQFVTNVTINARFVYLCIIRRVMAHELSYTPPMSMPTSKPTQESNMGRYAR